MMDIPSLGDLYEPAMSPEDFARAVTDSDLALTLTVTDEEGDELASTLTVVNNYTPYSDTQIREYLRTLDQSADSERRTR